MKHFLPRICTLSVVLILCILTTLNLQTIVAAQNSAYIALPKGAKARLGKGSIRKLAYTPDGNHLLVASSIGIWTYNADTLETLDLFDSTRFSNGDVVFSLDRRLFATRRGDHEETTAHLWNRIQRQHITNLKGHTRYIDSLDFSPDGNTLATGSSDHTARLWDITTGAHKMTLAGHTETVTSVAFSPDGKTLATGSWDDTVRLWDTTTGEHKPLLTDQSGEGIDQMAFSPDGETLAIIFYNTIGIELWDVNTGERKKRLWTNRNISCVAFSPDSKRLAGGGWSELHLWHIDTDERMTLTGHLKEVVSVTFNPDGRTLASASADELHLWDSATGAQIGTITGHTQYIRGFAVSPDGHTIATGNREQIRLWDTINRAEKAILYEDDWGNDNLAFSPDGSILASNIGPRIRIWDVATGTHITRLKTYRGSGVGGSIIRAIAFSPNGCFFANGHIGNETVWLWSAGFTRNQILTGHTKQVSALAFSPDSRTLASGSFDHTIHLWDTQTGTHKTTLTGHTKRIESIAFSPDGKILASASRDGPVRLWDTISGGHKATLTGYSDSVAFSPDGKTLAGVSNYDGRTVRLWDVTRGINKTSLTGHASHVSHVAFSPDGKTLISASYDGTILLWDLTPETNPVTQVKEGVVEPNDLVPAPAIPFPTQTVLLPNYPNPFNPETWIPYQLAKPADVTVHIYSMMGRLVRTLILGYQPAGIYQNRSRAAYWDGKNEVGESVASGVYFYTLSTESTRDSGTAGDFSATRRMLILK